jgi:Domain of unknown function (DUF4105)
MKYRIFLSLLLCCLLGPVALAAGESSGAPAWQQQQAQWRAARDQRFQAFASRSDFLGLEILAVGPDTTHPERSFGHVAVRFLSPGEPLHDVVVGYGANVTDKDLDMAKGIKGTYALDLSIWPLQDFLGDYLMTQGRSVRRLILPASPARILALRDVLVNDYLHPSKNYAFFGELGQLLFEYQGENCSEAMQDALARAGFPLPDGALIPTEIEALLRDSGLAPYPALDFFDPKTLLQRMSPFTRGAPLEGLKAVPLLDYFRWVQLAKPTLREKGLMLAVYRNKPEGDPQALKDAEIYGLVSADPAFYGEELQAWKGHAEFAQHAQDLCRSLPGAILHPRFRAAPEMGEKLVADYRKNCL